MNFLLVNKYEVINSNIHQYQRILTNNMQYFQDEELKEFKNYEEDTIMGLDEEPEFVNLVYEGNPDVQYKLFISADPNNRFTSLIDSTIENDKSLINGVFIIKRIDINNGNFTPSEELGCVEFIIKYMKAYENKKEHVQPPSPIQVHEITKWMSDSIENKLFERYIPNFDDDEDSDTDKQLMIAKQHWRELSMIALLSNWLEMDILLHKVCALMGNIIRDRDNDYIAKVARSKCEHSAFSDF